MRQHGHAATPLGHRGARLQGGGRLLGWRLGRSFRCCRPAADASAQNGGSPHAVVVVSGDAWL
eukprot:113445-Alexandrium_andersonii.AAC.1